MARKTAKALQGLQPFNVAPPCPDWSYAFTIQMPLRKDVSVAAWNEALAKAKEAFEFRTAVVAFSQRVDSIFFGEALHLAHRNRERYISLLQSMIVFLREVGFSKLAQGELLELAIALDELGRGSVRPFLEPAYKPPRPIDPGDKWAVRALFSIAVAALMQEDISRREASKLVANAAREAKHLVAPKAATLASAIEGWHRQFSGERVKDARARLMFQDREKLIAQTAQYLSLHLHETFERQEPQRNDVALKIASDAVSSAIRAATQDEFTKARDEFSRASKKLHYKSER